MLTEISKELEEKFKKSPESLLEKSELVKDVSSVLQSELKLEMC